MSNLECSSKGDKRFSAFYAKVNFYGKIDSIENIYQSVKRDLYDKQVRKGARVHHICINNLILEPKYLTPLYKLLWVAYLDSNPLLVQHASTFSTFTDMFRGKCINCQADVIKDYVKLGRDAILKNSEVVDFISILNQ